MICIKIFHFALSERSCTWIACDSIIVSTNNIRGYSRESLEVCNALRLAVDFWCTPLVDKFYLWILAASMDSDAAASTNNRHHPWITSSIRGYHELSCKFTSRFLTSLWIVIVPHFMEDKNGHLWQHRTDTWVKNSFFIPSQPSEVKLRKYVHTCAL